MVVLFNAGVVAGLPLKPPVQLYVLAPPPVKVAVWPAQIDGEFTVTVGFDFTRIVLVAGVLAVPPL